MADPAPSTATHIRRKLLVAGLGVAVLISVLSVLQLDEAPPPPLLKPNGFHAFALANRLNQRPDHPVLIGDLTVDQLRGVVQSNAATLEFVRVGLTHESRIPYPYDTNYIAARMPELGLSKSTALAMGVASRLALVEGRMDEAADWGVSAVRFSHEAFRGGVIIDKLVASGCEAHGLAALKALGGPTNALLPEICRRVIAALTRVDETREDAGQTLANEKQWLRTGTTLRERMEEWLPWKNEFPMSQADIEQTLRNRMEDGDDERRKVILLFARRAYELDHGKPPTEASDLVPEYLKAMPRHSSGNEMPVDTE